MQAPLGRLTAWLVENIPNITNYNTEVNIQNAQSNLEDSFVCADT